MDDCDAPDEAGRGASLHEPAERDSEHERVRALILARRNRFIAAALAGLGLSGGCKAGTCLVPNTTPASADDGGRAGTGGTAASDAARDADAAPDDRDAALPADGATPADGAIPSDGAAVIDLFKDAAPRVCLTPQ